MISNRSVTARALALAATALGLAACSGKTVTSSAPTSTTQPTTATGGTTATGTGGAPTTLSAGTPTAATASGTPRCSVADLSARAGQSNGATGHIGQVITLTNTSDVTCTLHGYPGLQMLGASGQALATNVLRTPSVVVQAENPTTVTLAPRQQGSFLLGYADQTGYGNRTCPASVNLEVTPPNAHDHLVIPDQISAYGPSADQCGTINVSPIYPGSGPQP